MCARIPPEEKNRTIIESRTLPSLKLVLVKAKGKAFTMGSPRDEVGRTRDGIEHQVTLSTDYYLGVTTVTRGQFASFVKSSSYQTEAENGAIDSIIVGWDEGNKSTAENKKHSWRNPGFPQTDEHPVVNVTWNDTVAFCKWLSCKDGRVYRLPTEAQWEYACRAESRTRFNFGNDDEDLVKNGNVADASLRKLAKTTRGIKGDDGYAFSSPVGKFRENAFGLLDMHGNVWQWCSDLYGPYSKEAVTDPEGGDETVADRFSLRMARGGSWIDEADYCRSSKRKAFGPGPVSVCYLGFRIAAAVK